MELIVVFIFIAVIWFSIVFFFELISFLALLIARKQKKVNDYEVTGSSYGVGPWGISGGGSDTFIKPGQIDRDPVERPSRSTIKRSDHIRMILEPLTLVLFLLLICYMLLKNESFNSTLALELLLVIILMLIIKLMWKFLLGRGMNNNKNIFYNLAWSKRILATVVCLAIVCAIAFYFIG